MIKAEQVMPSRQDLKKIAKKEMKARVKEIRAGRVIKRRYAPSTQKKRRRYGLRTDRVNLTGNRKYSGKSWRLLASWRVRIKDDRTVLIVWSRNEAANIHDAHVRRYGEYLKANKRG